MTTLSLLSPPPRSRCTNIDSTPRQQIPTPWRSDVEGRDVTVVSPTLDNDLTEAAPTTEPEEATKAGKPLRGRW
jgi:hypothetical protein